MSTIRFIAGLDLGQQMDPSSLCLLEHRVNAVPLIVRKLCRWPLGTPYTAVVADVVSLLSRPELSATLLCMDTTGVGRPVAEMFRPALRLAGALQRGGTAYVTITSGGETTHNGSDWNVAKRRLVSVLQVVLAKKQIAIPRELSETANLIKEMQSFLAEVTEAGNARFGGVKSHDDLVLALALAVWGASCVSWMPEPERHPNRPCIDDVNRDRR